MRGQKYQGSVISTAYCIDVLFWHCSFLLQKFEDICLLSTLKDLFKHVKFVGHELVLTVEFLLVSYLFWNIFTELLKISENI